MFLIQIPKIFSELPSLLTFLAGPPNSIQCPHKADVSFGVKANISVSMYKSPREKFAYVFMLASPLAPSMCCLT